MDEELVYDRSAATTKSGLRNPAFSFSRAVESYNNAAIVQKQVARKTAELINNNNLDKILDIGCGTGFVAQNLVKRSGIKCIGIDISTAMCRKSMQTGCYNATIASDMTSLPFPAKHFNLIISSLAVQWCNDLPLLHSELYRTICSDGSVVISTILDGTLRELDTCMKELFGTSSVKPLKNIEQYISCAKQAGFLHVETSTETIIHPFASASELIRNIILTGAHTNDSSLIMTRSKLKQLNQLYALKYRTQDALVASSWRIGYIRLAK